MLITKTVKTKWNPSNINHYKSKGYIFTKWNDEFIVKVSDLPSNSNVLVEIKCDCSDCKSPNLKPKRFSFYTSHVQNNGKYFCHKCLPKLFKDSKPKAIRKRNIKKSFKQWCIENNREYMLERWDYKLNNCSPNEISFSTMKKYYFKCLNQSHESELKDINGFTHGHEGCMSCKQCNSFAQWGIDNLGEDFLEKYWDYEKNEKININPWKISKCNSDNKVWIKCRNKDYHGSYDMHCSTFTLENCRCPYCSHKGNKSVHPLDSLGNILNDKGLLSIWSNKNKKSAYEYTPSGKQEVFWRCSEGKHNDYKRSIGNSNACDFRCPECQFSKGESKIEEILIKNKICFIPQKQFDGLLGLRGGNLSYDFYLPDYNLLIEYQGEFHDGSVPNQTKKDFNRQQEHDLRKRNFVKQNGYELLEIWYWDFSNIEEIVNSTIRKAS